MNDKEKPSWIAGKINFRERWGAWWAQPGKTVHNQFWLCGMYLIFVALFIQAVDQLRNPLSPDSAIWNLVYLEAFLGAIVILYSSTTIALAKELKKEKFRTEWISVISVILGAATVVAKLFLSHDVADYAMGFLGVATAVAGGVSATRKITIAYREWKNS